MPYITLMLDRLGHQHGHLFIQYHMPPDIVATTSVHVDNDVVGEWLHNCSIWHTFVQIFRNCHADTLLHRCFDQQSASRSNGTVLLL